MTQPTNKEQPTTIHRDVKVQNGDFVGSDKHIHPGPLTQYLRQMALFIVDAMHFRK